MWNDPVLFFVVANFIILCGIAGLVLRLAFRE